MHCYEYNNLIATREEKERPTFIFRIQKSQVLAHGREVA